MFSVVDATSTAEAYCWTRGASARTNGRSSRRSVSRDGRAGPDSRLGKKSSDLGLRHLAHGVPRQLGDDSNVAWHLIRCQPGLGPGAEPVAVQGLAGSHHHRGRDPLAEIRIADADDGAIVHRRMLAQGFLDLERRDLVSRRLDEVD